MRFQRGWLSRSSVGNFETTAGRGIYAVSGDGGGLGFRLILMVYHDPVQISHCSIWRHFLKVNLQVDFSNHVAAE